MTPPFKTAPELTHNGLSHGFFGRQGGVSAGIYASLNCGLASADDRANVIENRRRVIEALVPNARLLTIAQIHSANVITVTDAWPIGGSAEDDKVTTPQGDAMVTDRPGLALGILAADCAPILLADPKARVIGAVHAGWKGAFGGVIETTIEAMTALGAAPENIAAAIGPAISRASYEVGPEFRERFLATEAANERFFVPAPRADHFFFDLPGYAATRLRRAGVGVVTNLNLCTYREAADYFSYRRMTHRGEAGYGRNVSAILLRP